MSEEMPGGEQLFMWYHLWKGAVGILFGSHSLGVKTGVFLDAKYLCRSTGLSFIALLGLTSTTFCRKSVLRLPFRGVAASAFPCLAELLGA